MVFLQNIWWYLVLIGVMILVHELGHYWAARFFDVKIEAFSFGFGPRLFGFKHGETDFRFCAILFGGYVKMAGEQFGDMTDPGDQNANADPRNFLAKPRWQRMIISFAGPAINLVLAVVLLTGLFTQHYMRVPLPHSPIVGVVTPNGAAHQAGIREGDQVVKVDDIENPTWEDVVMKEIAGAGQAMQLEVKRDGKLLHFSVTPAYDPKLGAGQSGWMQESQVQVAGFVKGNDAAEKAGLEKGDILLNINGQPLLKASRLQEVLEQTKGTPIHLTYSRNGGLHEVMLTPEQREIEGQTRWMIGVQLVPGMEVVKLPLAQAFTESCHQNVQYAKLIFKFLEGILERRMSPKSIEGPFRIAQMSGEAARAGPVEFIMLMSGVSLNLAIFNLLPIPILDGGVILMLLIEMLLRRDLDLKVKEAVLKVGFVFLMVVVVFVLYNDLSKILPPS
ncbi:MAG: RIP metalloprotease RseP [Bryobacteraceae bacterium]|jgi:regulator of sigma E protease